MTRTFSMRNPQMTILGVFYIFFDAIPIMYLIRTKENSVWRKSPHQVGVGMHLICMDGIEHVLKDSPGVIYSSGHLGQLPIHGIYFPPRIYRKLVTPMVKN